MKARARIVLDAGEHGRFAPETAESLIGQVFPMRLPDGGSTEGICIDAVRSDDGHEIVGEIEFEYPFDNIDLKVSVTSEPFTGIAYTIPASDA